MASVTDNSSKLERPAKPQQEVSQAPARSYANHLAIHASLAEVLLDFGQHYPPSGMVASVSSLVTSPVHLMLFQQQLTGALARYEAEYGALPVLPQNTSPDRRS
jgi:hypothetical protein